MDSAWIRRLLDSYAFWLKEDLVERTGAIDEQSRRLFFAPFVVVSHADSEDPILNYGNRQALDLWEMTWAEFIATPSRLTVEPMNRDARARMLHRVAVHGFITDYQGVRISRTGRRFLVERATVWNVLDEHGIKRGQAASFSRWTRLAPTPGSPLSRAVSKGQLRGTKGQSVIPAKQAVSKGHPREATAPEIVIPAKAGIQAGWSGETARGDPSRTPGFPLSRE